MAVAAQVPFPKPIQVQPRDAPSQELAQTQPGACGAAGTGLSETLCKTTGHLASGKSTTSALYFDVRYCICVRHRNRGIRRLVEWQAQAANPHAFQVLFLWPCVQAKKELIQKDFSFCLPEAPIPPSKHIFTFLLRNNTSK